MKAAVPLELSPVHELQPTSIFGECTLTVPVDVSRPGVARGGFVTHRAGQLLQRANPGGRFQLSEQRSPA
jgi:hypothetical protein